MKFSYNVKRAFATIMQNGEYTPSQIRSLLYLTDNRTPHRWKNGMGLHSDINTSPHPLNELTEGCDAMQCIGIIREWITQQNINETQTETAQNPQPPLSDELKLLCVELKYRGLMPDEICEIINIEPTKENKKRYADVSRSLSAMARKFEESFPHETIVYNYIQFMRHKNCAQKQQRYGTRLKTLITKADPTELAEFAETRLATDNLTNAELTALKQLNAYIERKL
jgi:hypothetical protein